MLAPLANIVDVDPDPRTTVVDEVQIKFTDSSTNLPTNVTGVDVNDFTLTRNGETVSLAGLTVNGADDSYSLELTTVTIRDGTYLLTIVAKGSGIRDANGDLLANDAFDSFKIDTPVPSADIENVLPDPRNTAVANVAVLFDEPVTGVDIGDFELRRNGNIVSLTGLTVSGSDANYSLDLSTVTSASGAYVLTLIAADSDIVDSNDNPLEGNASDTWVTDTTAPTADIVDVTPDPRSTPVGLVRINFSEPVFADDVNIGDFALTRNGTAVSLVGLAVNAIGLTVDGTAATYTIDLSSVTTIFGSYTLTLVALDSGIKDAAGNLLAANASDSWTIDDEREQNDTLRTAHELGRLTGPVTIEHLGLVDANDWFRFTMAAKGGPADKVSITFQNAAGDLNLQLLNVSGQILRSSTGTSNSETISLSGRPAGTYYIRVFGKNGAVNPDYTLTVAAPVVLADDAYEQNDSRSAARNLGTPASPLVIPRLVMLDSHDWYRFRTLGPGTSADFVSINFPNAQGNLDLELYDASGRRLASSTGTASGQQISLNGRAAGTYFVHVLGVGGTRNADYTLQIDPPTAAAATPDTTFSVQLLFSGLTANQIAIFQQAAAKWQSIITSDLPNSNYFRAGFTSSVAVDDLLIEASAVTIDGSGNVLGRSAPDSFRSGSGLPYHGLMQIDKADLATLEANGTLLSAVEHEMAHILGFGSLWSSKGLLINSGTANVAFTGAQGVAAYNSVFSTTATSVPVENTGGAGTANSHWRESVFGNELMTGFLNSGVFNPLSRVTIASMADLGYSVNVGAADAYSPPTTTSPSGGTLLVGGTTTSSNVNVAGTGEAAAVDALLADWSFLSSSPKKAATRS